MTPKIQIHMIGTSHISQESVILIQKISEDVKPDVMCVELDRDRLQGLLHPNTQKISFYQILKKVGLFGAIFSYFGGKLQAYLGKKYGLKPGSDMLAAVKNAKEKNIRVALIDQPIHITLRRLSKQMTFKEYIKMFFETLVGLIRPKKTINKYGLHQISLSSVPSSEVIIKLLRLIKHKYPTIYKCLIEERNIYMSERIFRLIHSNKFQKIIVVVGAGHIDGMKQIFSKKEGLLYEYELIYHAN